MPHSQDCLSGQLFGNVRLAVTDHLAHIRSGIEEQSAICKDVADATFKIRFHTLGDQGLDPGLAFNTVPVQPVCVFHPLQHRGHTDNKTLLS